MPIRSSDFDEKVLYTKTNPENIISAPKGSWFFRQGGDFFVNTGKSWVKLPFKTVILPAPDEDRIIKYEQPFELWFKFSDGFYDEFRKLMPKTGWKFFSHKNIFAHGGGGANISDWLPVPTSSDDPNGHHKSKSYDENYFYSKINTRWYRTPITVFTFPTTDSGEQSDLYNQLPYAHAPRFLPVPPNSNTNTANAGEETYDDEFYYIKTSKWKRCSIIMFRPSKMTVF